MINGRVLTKNSVRDATWPNCRILEWLKWYVWDLGDHCGEVELRSDTQPSSMARGFCKHETQHLKTN